MAWIGPRVRRRLARGARTQLVMLVPSPGRVSLVGMAGIDGRQEVVARTTKVAWRAGRIEVPLRLDAAARKVLGEPGEVLRLKLIARYSRSPGARTVVLELKAPR